MMFRGPADTYWKQALKIMIESLWKQLSLGNMKVTDEYGDDFLTKSDDSLVVYKLKW